MSKDYALDMRRIRQSAIDTCIQIVLEDPHEDLIAGWTLSCPGKSNTLRTLPFQECVLLLTSAAIYFCRFDWDAEKVASFERVDLLDVSEMWRGVYITSALGSTNLDETKNVGFALRYKATEKSIVRRDTRSLQNEGEAEEEIENDEKSKKQDETTNEKLLAFKILPPESSAATDDGVDLANINEVDLSKHIDGKIENAVKKAFLKDRGFDHLSLDQIPQVQEKDIVSVVEAKKNTGYLESIGYSMKRLVWS